MITAVAFAGGILACYLAARLLGRARWSWHSPRVAILCWQGVGLALGLSAIGLPLALGLRPDGQGLLPALLALGTTLVRGDLPTGTTVVSIGLVGVGLGVAAVLLSSTVRSLCEALRIRRRHRDLLALVARDDPAAPGALVLDHPSAAAYCLPGIRPQVVVSAGTLSLLDRAQLAAVLSHERTHAQERHDLVLLPFTALCRALPAMAWLRAAADRVALLVEMRADDKARQLHSEGPLAGALLRFAAAGAPGTPPGTLGATDVDLQARVSRLLVTGRPPRLHQLTALGGTTALVCLPISLFLG